MRDYLATVLRREFFVDDLVTIGSLEELGRREAELANVALVLFDIDLGDGSTLEWALARAAGGGSGVLVALSSISGAFPFKKLQLAGISVVHKQDEEADLVDVIRRTLAGGMMLSKVCLAKIMTSNRDPVAPLKLLGPKEQQVLALLGQRLGNDEVAAIVGCSPATALDHRKRIMRKLGLHCIEDVIDYALKHGVVHEANGPRR